MLRRAMGTPGTITLLHLSSLRIGPSPHEGAGAETAALVRLRQDLDRLRDQEGVRPDLLVFTGDLTESGKRSEFERARRFALQLASLLELPAGQVVTVPGNHDINWKASEAYFSACEADEVQPTFPFFPKLRHFAESFAAFYAEVAGTRFTEAEPWSVFEVPERKIVVAGMNSTTADSHRPGDHYAFLGAAQIEALAAKMRPYKEQGYLRLGVVHHDLSRAENAAALEDFEAFREALLPYLSFVVHGGHAAEPLVFWGDAVPALGLPRDEAATLSSGALPYQLVQLTPEGLRFGADSPGFTEAKVTWTRAEAAFCAAPAPHEEGAADLARAVEAYRRYIVEHESVPTLVELIGFGADTEVRSRLDWRQIFVEPAVRKQQPFAYGEYLDTLGDKPAAFDPARLLARIAPFAGSPPEPLERALTAAYEPWVFLLGTPGAGKTAVTRWLTLKLCVPGDRLKPLRDDLVPVRIDMRLFDAAPRHGESALTAFLAYLDEAHAEKRIDLRGKALRALAEQGRLLWIFDGLDEVSDARSRQRYAAQIAELKAACSGCRGLITSRLVGAEPVAPLFDRAGIVTYRLEDFDELRIDAFLDQWHAVAFPETSTVGQRRRERLGLALKSSSPLQELCGNPLLLTIVATLNRDDELPDRRHRIYREAFRRMVDQWDANKELPPRSGQRRFDYDDKARFLRQLARRMLDEKGNAIAERELIGFAARFCEATYGEARGDAEQTARQLVQNLRERNEVLTLLGGETFGFLHKAFLEYLAAEEVHHRFRSHAWDMSHVVELFQEKWLAGEVYQETLVLLCGLLGEDQPAHVVEVLQGIAEERSLLEVELTLYVTFSIRCLSTLTRLDQGLACTFITAMMHLIEHVLLSKTTFTTEEAIWWSRIAFSLAACSGRWPDPDRFRQWALARKGRPGFLLLYSCCLTASSRDKRIDLTLEAFGIAPHSESHPVLLNALLKLAEQLGGWTPAEARELIKHTEHSDDRLRLVVLKAIVLSAFDAAQSQLLNILRSTTSEGIKLDVAEGLTILYPEQREAEDAIATLLNSDDIHIRRKAASIASHIWYSANIVSMLCEAICNGSPTEASNALHALLMLSEADADAEDEEGTRNIAQKKLPEIANCLSTIENKLTLVRVADILSKKGDPLATAATKALDELLWSDSEKPHRLEAGLVMIRTPGLMKRGFAGLKALLSVASESKFLVRFSAPPFNKDPDVDQLLRDLTITATVPLMRAEAAKLLLTRSPTPEVESGAVQALEELCLDTSHPETQVDAAIIAGHHEILTKLAWNSPDEAIRLKAARAIADPDALRALASTATDAAIRETAQSCLKTLDLLDALIAVGKPRRAQVLLRGLLTGLLEETPTGTRFTYDPTYLASPAPRPVGPGLALRPEPYEREGLHPFFANLLPQGFLLEQTAKRLGLPRSDRFGILLAVGADVMGAIQVLPVGGAPS